MTKAYNVLLSGHDETRDRSMSTMLPELPSGLTSSECSRHVPMQ
jgi:hypothetical protein